MKMICEYTVDEECEEKCVKEIPIHKKFLWDEHWYMRTEEWSQLRTFDLVRVVNIETGYRDHLPADSKCREAKEEIKIELENKDKIEELRKIEKQEQELKEKRANVIKGVKVIKK